MTSSRSARGLLCVLATAASVLTAAPTATAQVAGSAELVLPARFPAAAPLLVPRGASAEAVAYELDTRVGAGPVAVVRSRQTGERRILPGRRVTGVAGRWVALREADERTTAELLDVTTGLTREIALSRTFEDVYPLADGGWVELLYRSGDDHRLLQAHRLDGSIRSEVDLGRVYPSAIEVDGDGVILLADQFFGDSLRRTVYADFGTGQARVLQTARKGCDVALTASALAWCDDEQRLIRVDRATGARTSTRPVTGGAVSEIALTESATGWLVRSPTEVLSLHTSSERNPSVSTRLQAPLQGPYQYVSSDGAQFVTPGGGDARSRGLYGVTPGATGFGPALDLAGPVAPAHLVAGPGRVVLAEQATPAPGLRLVEQAVQAEGGQVTARGVERERYRGLGGTAAALSGTNLAYGVSRLDGRTDVVVTDGPEELARVTTPGGVAGLSGHRLLLRADSPRVEGRQQVRSTVVDLRRGGAQLVVDGAAALEGSRLARITGDGAVLLRDLEDAGAEVELRAAGLPRDPVTVPQELAVRLAGPFVAWTISSGNGAAVHEARVHDTSTGQSRAVPGRPEQLSLAGDRAAWVDADSREVHVLDLRTGEDLVVGRQADARRWRAVLGLDSAFAAWADEQGRTVVRALPARDEAPRLLGGLVAPRFSPRTGLVPRLDADRPLDSARLTVRDRAGTVVATIDGSAPEGGLRLRWDGRLPDGRLAPGGTYSWDLAASAGGRPLQATAGTPLSGQSVLDTTAPSTRLSAPGVAAEPRPGFAVGAGTDDPTATVRLDVALRQRTRDGRWVTGDARRWLTVQGSTAHRYGGGLSPHRLVPGTVLVITQTTQDEAGNRTSATRSTLVPYDDRDRALRYSSGWASATAAGHVAGTFRETTARGRTVSLTGVYRRITVTGTRCGTCGRFRVLVDGRVVRTVDTRGRLASRQLLLDLVVSAAPAKHTVTLVTEGTSGRPRVRVDAVGVAG